MLLDLRLVIQWDAFRSLFHSVWTSNCLNAYALACDVVTADGRHTQVKLRMLEEVREELKIDRLHAGAIEWGARVRHILV